ncbi:MAG: AMP-binding protein [Rhodoferax sp.]|uniref:AMP-binding protein n=1 Tax=Rhodoferax sp. TaxID=50421 RepID=UPI00262F4265|nr:AMP-binding protein [Rhodoferax sp.]MDD2882879.1 AMP-binding protein [Rhodoferax sp.]
MPNYHFNLALLFNEVLATYAMRPALRYADREYRYSELSGWVNALAALLLAQGCHRGDVIAIGHNKRPLSYALMLAAIRLGIAYVNIDVASPTARTGRILQVSDAALLFFDDPTYQDAMTELAATKGCRLLMLDEKTLPVVTDADLALQQRLARGVDGACIAYIMFTSGSTGVPKGVAVTHQNVLHFITWGQQRFGITDQDNFANLSPMYFDNSVFDFYVGLFSGAALTPVYRELLTNPYELVQYIGRMACTIWFSVPSLLIYLMAMKAMTPQGLASLRAIVFGGEGYPKIELKKLYDRFSGQASLVNVYGPTECTCICSGHTLGDADFLDLTGLPTLGHLNPNFDYRILDEEEHDASSGELCLIGPNVAAGYFNDLERTAASFHTLTESNRYMKRMYRTGDLVREEAGMLHFIGRKDNQIKHMGYRIELEEIEHALAKLPEVSQAAVVYHRTNAAYGKLVAYVACPGQPDDRVLLKALADLLPDYMVPNKLIVMSELPKNPNGKVDRQHLRALLDD